MHDTAAPENKKPPEGGFFALCWQRTPIKRRTDESVRAGLPEVQAAAAWARALTLARQAALVASGLVLVEDALVGDGVHDGSAPWRTVRWPWSCRRPATAFSTFFTAVRYLERSEVFAALSLTSWRTRLRPDARRGFFFLGLADAMMCVPCVSGDDASKALDYSRAGRFRPAGRRLAAAPRGYTRAGVPVQSPPPPFPC